MELKNIIFTLIITVILTNCFGDDKDNCIGYEPAPVVSTTTPSTGQVNEDIAINVSFRCYNGCGQFGSFEDKWTGNTLTIKVIAKYEGCICSMDVPIRQATYTFRTSKAGTYYLKFWQNDDSYLIDTLVILDNPGSF